MGGGGGGRGGGGGGEEEGEVENMGRIFIKWFFDLAIKINISLKKITK